jgi:hypothetical protein
VNPLCADAAAKIGGAAGAAIGCYTATRREVLKIRGSVTYKNWRDNAVKTKVYPIFEKYVNTKVSDSFKCPYTSSLILRPVRDRHGHVFEHDEIMKHLRNSQGAIKCPHTMEPITESDLTFDLEYHKNLLRELEPAFNAAIQDPTVVAGALAFKDSVKEERKAMFQAEMEPLTDQLLECKSQAERDEVLQQYRSQASHSAEKYGIG